jgi:uncharacterized protein
MFQQTGFPPSSTDAFPARLRHLEALLDALDGLAVAFSGGVDSAVLLHAAHARLGERALGVIADSPSLPRAELARARAFAAERGIALEVVATAELADARYTANAGDRCFFCKEALFAAMELVARRRGLATLAFGEIADDALDHRPGSTSARARGVRGLLAEAGFAKTDVRRYAREHDLPMWDQPASACLASRLPIGTTVTAERLARVERAEEAVRALGFRVLRVRDHGTRARVEVGADERERAGALANALAAALRLEGFEALELGVYGRPAAS